MRHLEFSSPNSAEIHIFFRAVSSFVLNSFKDGDSTTSLSFLFLWLTTFVVKNVPFYRVGISLAATVITVSGCCECTLLTRVQIVVYRIARSFLQSYFLA